MKTKTLIVALIAMLCMACTEDRTGEIYTEEKLVRNCTEGTQKDRADFILQCLANANPKSDEEPEDWIGECQVMAEQTLCPKVRMRVTYLCTTRKCYFPAESKREPIDT